MAKGFWIAHVTVTDTERYALYIAAAKEPLKQYGARFSARGGRHQTLEGAARERHVVIEFPTYEAAIECYHSPQYQAARKHRLDAALCDVVIIEELMDQG